MSKALIAAVISVFLVSCANQQMYEGPKQTPDKIAQIKPGTPSLLSFDPEVLIEEIDGVPPRNKVTVDTPIYEVLPGHHRVKVRLRNLSAPYVRPLPSRSIEFNASAGETYIVFYRWRNRGESDWILFVKDDRTGKVVAER